MADVIAALTAALSGRYRIERELGAGGMATVYLATEVTHERKVAVNVLKPELAAVLGAERFVVEITTTANLRHPHILPLFDSGQADDFLYYVMPFIDLSNVDTVWVRGHATATGAIIGSATALVLGIASYLVGTGRCEYDCETSAGEVVGGTLLTAGLGVLVGAGIGALIPKWKRRYP